MKSFIVLLFLVIAIAITPLASAASCLPGLPSTCCISDEWRSGGWINLVSIGLLLIFLSFSLVYMVSQIVGKHEWVVWIKDEFYQIIISVVIVTLLIFVLSAICTVFNSIAGGDPYQIAHSYLDSLVWDKTINLATQAFQYSLLCQLVAAYKTHIGSKTLGTTFSQHLGLRTVATDFDFLYTLFAGLSASLMVQDIGLSIIQAFAFRIMLPLGILFRIFPFLRKAGAMFIGLALGLYIVYPLCFVMDQMLVNSVLSTNLNGVLISSAADVVSLVGVATLAVISPFLPWAVLGLVTLMQQAAEIIPQAVFLPTLNLVITLTFVKNATRILSQNFGEG